MKVPVYIVNWFKQQQWKMHSYQKKMFAAFSQKNSTLLIVPTGGGKTLASFLPSLADIHARSVTGLHTLYLSPLKALSYDIERNLVRPIQEMNLLVKIDVRTGDTSQYKRQRQRKAPPHILLTTPESLLLMLSHNNAQEFFKKLKVVIIDELHSYVNTKRGHLTALALARLAALAPAHIRFGLSATVARPQELAAWLGNINQPAAILAMLSGRKPPRIKLLIKDERIPYYGYRSVYAMQDIYNIIHQYTMTLIFVNTRAQTEAVFHALWQINNKNLPIAIYHGSLSKLQRHKISSAIALGKIRAIVATSALELGIDWGNIDCVIQVGAPKGVSRLLQRIGRSNHQFDKASEAWLVPANCFDALECQAAIQAIAAGVMDGESLTEGALDVVIQYIMNCACSQPIDPELLYQEICTTYPYRHLTKTIFTQLFQFVVNGGYVLQHYAQYQRLIQNPDRTYSVISEKAKRRHRQNVGTIIESAKLYVKKMYKRGSKMLGEIEESFAQQLVPGDTFLFAGEVLAFIRIKEMILEARSTKKTNKSKLPIYAGGTMPLSTYLAEAVLNLINSPPHWVNLPPKVQDWLQLQARFSSLPARESLLIECFPYKKLFYTVIYCFGGKRAHYTLGMLMTFRMEKQNLKPLSYNATDYGLAISSLKPLTLDEIKGLLLPSIVTDELTEWLTFSPALKRAFRSVAIIAGLTTRQLASQRKTMKQVTFSTDLIYDVLLRHEPHHILLTIAQHDVNNSLLDIEHLISLLKGFAGKFTFKPLARPSPLSLPLLLAIQTEHVQGAALEDLLMAASADQVAAHLIEEVKMSVGL